MLAVSRPDPAGVNPFRSSTRWEVSLVAVVSATTRCTKSDSNARRTSAPTISVAYPAPLAPSTTE